VTADPSRGLRTKRSTEGSDRQRIAGVGHDAVPLVTTDAPALDRFENGSWEIEPRLDETEFDSVEEVDAVARSLRRVAIEYGAAITVVLLVVPLLSLVAPWWFGRPIFGGMTLNFLFVAVMLHVAFLVVALLFNRVASRSEDEMLGRLEDPVNWDGP
jgi:uncharacterized membrane protein (DUF485 family)